MKTVERERHFEKKLDHSISNNNIGFLNVLKFITFTIFYNYFVNPNRPKDVLGTSDVFCEKGVLKIFAKFTGKHLCQSLSNYLPITGTSQLTDNFLKTRFHCIWQISL